MNHPWLVSKSRGRAAGSERLRGEPGVTLFELMLSLLMLSFVMAIAFSFLTGSDTVLGNVVDTTAGQRDITLVTDRLTRDLRAARGVDASATNHSLTIWIDYDSNYIQSPAETITWTLTPGSTAGKYDAIRSTGAGSSQVLGSTLVDNVVFSYTSGASDPLSATPTTLNPSTDASSIEVVGITLTYDAITNGYATPKTIQLAVRLRNVQ